MNPNDDGITHINVYSNGHTDLGRFLSNFAHTPIVTIDGRFESIEGYWYWLLSGDERLRELYGWDAKRIGREVSKGDWLKKPEHKEAICNAITIKIMGAAPYMIDLFKDSTLPFVHYYVFGDKVVEPERGKWVIEWLETLRRKANGA
jgi:hypothetical protein